MCSKVVSIVILASVCMFDLTNRKAVKYLPAWHVQLFRSRPRQAEREERGREAEVSEKRRFGMTRYHMARVEAGSRQHHLPHKIIRICEMYCKAQPEPKTKNQNQISKTMVQGTMTWNLLSSAWLLIFKRCRAAFNASMCAFEPVCTLFPFGNMSYTYRICVSLQPQTNFQFDFWPNKQVESVR